MVDFTQLNYSVPAVNYICIGPWGPIGGGGYYVAPGETSYGAHNITTAVTETRRGYFYDPIAVYTGTGSTTILGRSGVFDPVSEMIYISIYDTASANSSSIMITNNYREWITGNLTLTKLNSSSGISNKLGSILYHDGANLITALGSSVSWRPEGGPSVDNSWNTASIFSGVSASGAVWGAISKINNLYYFGGGENSTFTAAPGASVLNRAVISTSNSSSINGIYNTVIVGPSVTTGGPMAFNQRGASVIAYSYETPAVQQAASAIYTASIYTYISANNGSSWTRNFIVGINGTNVTGPAMNGAGIVGNRFAVSTGLYNNNACSVTYTDDGVNHFTVASPAIDFFLSARSYFFGFDSSLGISYFSRDAINWTQDSAGVLSDMFNALVIF